MASHIRGSMKKEINYPAEITFKSVFSHNPELHEIITTILIEHGVEGQVSHKPSKNSKFISFTITAEFKSESHLNDVCTRIATIRGFIMMM
jgi:putative lipoic acid-binding regulatory protein